MWNCILYILYVNLEQFLRNQSMPVRGKLQQNIIMIAIRLYYIQYGCILSLFNILVSYTKSSDHRYEQLEFPINISICLWNFLLQILTCDLNLGPLRQSSQHSVFITLYFYYLSFTTSILYYLASLILVFIIIIIQYLV